MIGVSPFEVLTDEMNDGDGSIEKENMVVIEEVVVTKLMESRMGEVLQQLAIGVEKGHLQIGLGAVKGLQLQELGEIKEQ